MTTVASTFTADDQRLSNPRAAMVHMETCSKRGYASQRAHDLRNGPQPSYVDVTRSHRNRVLIEPPPAQEMRRLAEERRNQRNPVRAMKSNAGIAVIGIIGFGVEAAKAFAGLGHDQQDAALLEAGHAIAAEANTTLEGMVWHDDETSGHGHGSFCGYDLDGTPLSETMKRGMLAAFQDRLAEIMAVHAPGIERGRRKSDRLAAGASYAETLHKTVRELHQSLPLELDAQRQELEEARARVAEMGERAESARAKAAAAEAQIEALEARLAANEKRLDERTEELGWLALEVARLEAGQAEGLRLEAEREEEHNRRLKAREVELGKAMAEINRLKASRCAEIQRRWDARRSCRDRASRLDKREASAEVRAHQVAFRSEALQQQAKNLDQRSKAVDAEIVSAVQIAVKATTAVIRGDLTLTDGKWQGGKNAPSPDQMKPFWPLMLPALRHVAVWWAGVKGRVDALPEQERNAFFEKLPTEEPGEEDDRPGF
jgi:hypothetical protein